MKLNIMIAIEEMKKSTKNWFPFGLNTKMIIEAIIQKLFRIISLHNRNVYFFFSLKKVRPVLRISFLLMI